MFQDPRIFADKPWTMRRTWPDAIDDYAVVIGGQVAGRIFRQPRAFGAVVWMWTFTGGYIPPDMQPSSGECGSLAEAKAGFRAKVDTWLPWAVASV